MVGGDGGELLYGERLPPSPRPAPRRVPDGGRIGAAGPAGQRRSAGPLVLISQFQTPAAILATGQAELEQCLRGQKVRHAAKLANAAINAAQAQQVRVPGEAIEG
jgi:hypothetical protein